MNTVSDDVYPTAKGKEIENRKQDACPMTCYEFFLGFKTEFAKCVFSFTAQLSYHHFSEKDAGKEKNANKHAEK